MIIPRLAWKNLKGAGIRTWLNVVVLSFSFVLIIWTQGLYIGMGEQATIAMVDAEIGGGQYWHMNYDPYDPLTLQDAHGVIPEPLQKMVEAGQAVPVLITQATIYPNGRMYTIQMKGIPLGQKIVSLPSHFLVPNDGDIPAVIGKRMSESSGLKEGDVVTVRWRDALGTFDARDVRIAKVIITNVQTSDQGKIWIALEAMQELMQVGNEDSYVTVAQDTAGAKSIQGWPFKDLDFLMADIKALVQSKTAGASILYAVMLLLAMLAIFNTQVLSIFRRRKEMGTLMALGFTISNSDN